MTNTMEQQTKIGWKFPKEFWLANFMELCERAAYYGFFIVLTLYLTDIVGVYKILIIMLFPLCVNHFHAAKQRNPPRKHQTIGIEPRLHLHF